MRPQASGHGSGGSAPTGARKRDPEMPGKKQASQKAGKRELVALHSAEAFWRPAPPHPPSAILTTLPLIGACAHMLIGQFPISLALWKTSIDNSLDPAHTTRGMESLSFPIPTW